LRFALDGRTPRAARPADPAGIVADPMTFPRGHSAPADRVDSEERRRIFRRSQSPISAPYISPVSRRQFRRGDIHARRGEMIMAHEISMANGIGEAAFALKPAWHGLGTVLDYVPDSEAMMQAAHLDWRVELHELQTAGGKAVPDNFATVRSDNGEVLGVVGSKYRIVQNHESFAFLDSLLQDGIIRYESAGALRGGRIVWALARMPSVDQIAEGDDVRRYILFQTSHDGSSALHAIPTSVRVVCANTLRVAVASDVGFRHTGDVKSKLEFARRYLSQFDEKFTLFRDKARRLAETRWTPQQARDYIEALFPSVDQAGRAQTIRNRKVAAVRGALVNRRNSFPSIKGTWWALLNSVTESIDHDERRTYATQEARETRLLSLTDGAGADFKAKALRVAVEMAAV